MPDIVTTSQRSRDFRMHTVESAAALSGPWTSEPYVYCDRLSLQAGGIDGATLSFHFGRLIQAGDVATAEHAVKSLRRKFVRVTLDQGTDSDGEEVTDFVWYGFVVGEDQSRYGAHLKPDLAGDVQVFAAVGLEWFLDRAQVTTSRIFPSTIVKRAIPFNAATGDTRQSSLYARGNRDPERSLFAPTLDNAAVWTGGQIVRYVLAEHVPRTNAGIAWPCSFSLDVNAPLEWFTPTVMSEGRTPLALVNEIISPRRGLSWRLVFNANSLAATIVVFSFSEINFVLPSGTVFPQNANLVTLDFDRALDIDTAALRFVEGRQYDRVRARGARRGACFTLSHADGTLEADWEPTLTGAYWDAAKNTPGYASLGSSQQAIRNDEFRRSEDLMRVFRCFRIPRGWDGRAGDGSGMGAKDFVFPVLDVNGLITNASEPFWHAGLRLLNHTELLTDHDYTTSPPADGTPAGSLAELRPPFVLFEIDAAGGKFQYADMLDSHGPDGAAGKLSASWYLRMQEASFGFMLAPSAGLPHLLADNATDWPSEGSLPPAPTQYEPELDWRAMRATVFCECDTHAEAVYPTMPIAAANLRALEELVIDIGERARLDYLAPRTVFDHQGGVPRLASSGGQFLRDDRPLLKDLARIAFVWYERPRAAFELSYRQLTALFTIGDLIAQIGKEETLQAINTVVTNIDYDLVRGVTHVRTSFAELDFGEFLPL